jgi:hypothetical protein
MTGGLCVLGHGLAITIRSSSNEAEEDDFCDKLQLHDPAFEKGRKVRQLMTRVLQY